MAAMLIFMEYVYSFQDFVRRFSKTNIFRTATEKERERHIYVHVTGTVTSCF